MLQFQLCIESCYINVTIPAMHREELYKCYSTDLERGVAGGRHSWNPSSRGWWSSHPGKTLRKNYRKLYQIKSFTSSKLIKTIGYKQKEQRRDKRISLSRATIKGATQRKAPRWPEHEKNSPFNG